MNIQCPWGVTVLRRYRGRIAFRSRCKLPPFVVPVILTIILSLAFFQFVSSQLSPIVYTMAQSKSKNMISRITAAAVDDCLAAENMTYKDFVLTEVGSSGQIAALSFQTSEGAQFKRQVIDRLVDELELISTSDLSIPVGTLSGALLFSAFGPSIRVKVQSIGDVSAEYRNEFTSAGVNQTKHSVYLDISVVVYLLIPGEIVSVSSCEQICVAETIIVGEVPDTYLSLQNGEH